MSKRLLPSLFLLGYSFLLIKVMVFKDVPLIRVGFLMLNFGGTHDGAPNFIPFKTILPYLMGFKGWLIAGINILGNIILLVPVGFLMPLVFAEMNWRKMLLLAIASGFVIESMQVLLHVGIFDIDDVILNGFGVMIGYWNYLLLQVFIKSPIYRKTILFPFGLLLLVATVYGAVLYQKDLLPIGFGSGNQMPMPGRLMRPGSASPANKDLCGGTNGTGQIVRKEMHTITIKRNDGVEELIKLTSKTSIKNSSGTASELDLKIGDRVTVVVGLLKEDPHAATLVLICAK